MGTPDPARSKASRSRVAHSRAVAAPDPSADNREQYFPYQLSDAYLYDCSVERREAHADDTERPHFELSLRTEERGDGFFASLGVRVVFRFRPEATAVLATTTVGVFQGGQGTSTGDAERFRKADCAVLLWPYARANIGTLSKLLDLDLPPLPTIDVRAALPGWREAETRPPQKPAS